MEKLGRSAGRGCANKLAVHAGVFRKLKGGGLDRRVGWWGVDERQLLDRRVGGGGWMRDSYKTEGVVGVDERQLLDRRVGWWGVDERQLLDRRVGWWGWMRDSY